MVLFSVVLVALPSRQMAKRNVTGGDDFAEIFGHVTVPPHTIEIDQEEIAKAQQEEAGAEQQGRETAAGESFEGGIRGCWSEGCF